MKVFVVKNEQHSLFPEQIEILKEYFGSYEEFLVPADGWKLSEMKGHVEYLANNADIVVFASPVPYMLKELSALVAQCMDANTGAKAYALEGVYVFHNDRREKKELPNGHIVQTVASTGWKLV
jgi:hypothetical protein